MIEIEIDGRPLTAPEGATIIEVADEVGIYIPRFCYHKNLSIAANCRMCLVEVEKVAKPLPACATTVTSGMKIFTRSKKTMEAQRAVMEFLLINHPLDCPICDQGGECELQDLSMGFGRADSCYDEPKRSVASENIGPLIETWMTRCIHCTRCVRFGEEIAGLREMGATGRGEAMEIGTYVKHFLKSELSGNIIDICPVGALTNKPARYTGRSWEYREHETIAPHDGVGSHLYVHSCAKSALTAERAVRRAVPRECVAINETWASDRDRFSVHGLYDRSRVAKPRVNRNGEWVEVEWQRALDEIVDRTQAIIQQFGADQIAGLASPNATVEELYLLQKLMRGLGSDNIDHRLRTHDFSDQAQLPQAPVMAGSIAEIENFDTIILIGSNLRHEQPMLAHRVYKATRGKTEVWVINPVDYEFIFEVKHRLLVEPQKLVEHLLNLVGLVEETATTALCETTRAMAQALGQKKKTAIFLGEHAQAHPQAAKIRALSHRLAERIGAGVNELTGGANGVGAWLSGCVPHRTAGGVCVEKPGFDAKRLLTTERVRGYFLLNTELEFDCAYAQEAMKTLHHAGLVVCLSPFATEAMQAYADFILPIAPFTETAGTLVNMEGRWQSFAAATNPQDDSKPAWKVLRVLANFFELKGFEHKTVDAVRAELWQQIASRTPFVYTPPLACEVDGSERRGVALYRLAPWPMYRSDALVRRSKPLQELLDPSHHSIGLNTQTAFRLGFEVGDHLTATQGESSICLPLWINDRLTDNVVWLPAGLEETAGFGEAEAAITLTRGRS